MPLPLATAMLIGSGISAGGSLLGGLLNKQPTMQTGYDIYKPDLIPGWENLQGTNVSYLSEVMDQLRRGEVPSYMQKWGESARKRRMQSLQESYFGIPGERTGTVQSAYEAGTIGGTGPKAAMSQAQKQYQQFNSDTAAVDQLIDEIMGGYTQQMATQIPQFASQAVANAPYTTISYGGGATPSGGGLGAGLGAAGSAIGQGLYNYGLMSAFGGGTNAPGLSTSATTPGWITPGQGGYGVNAPSGVYNTGSMSLFPR